MEIGDRKLEAEDRRKRLLPILSMCIGLIFVIHVLLIKYRTLHDFKASAVINLLEPCTQFFQSPVSGLRSPLIFIQSFHYIFFIISSNGKSTISYHNVRGSIMIYFIQINDIRAVDAQESINRQILFNS